MTELKNQKSVPQDGFQDIADSTARAFSQLIKSRTSAITKCLGAPAPSLEEVYEILSHGLSAPDHGGLTAWRFCPLMGEDLNEFAVLALQYFQQQKEKNGTNLTKEEIANFLAKVKRAPLVVAVWASPSNRKPIPPREQIYSVLMAVAQILLRLSFGKYRGVFLTGFIADNRKLVEQAFGLKPQDEFLGYIYIGTEHLPESPAALPMKKRSSLKEFLIPYQANKSG